MTYKTWEFGYLVEPGYKLVRTWLTIIRRYGPDEAHPTETRATKDIDHG